MNHPGIKKLLFPFRACLHASMNKLLVLAPCFRVESHDTSRDDYEGWKARQGATPADTRARYSREDLLEETCLSVAAGTRWDWQSSRSGALRRLAGGGARALA